MLLCDSSRREEGFFIPVTAQPVRSHYTSSSQFTPVGFSLQQPLPTPPFLPKRASSPFVLPPCLCFCLGLLVPDCKSLLFPRKPIFAGKITDSFIFKVNRMHVDNSTKSEKKYVRKMKSSVEKQKSYWSWRIQWMKWKNAIFSVNIRLDQTEERICEHQTGHLKLYSHRRKKKTQWKKVKKAYVNYGAP